MIDSSYGERTKHACWPHTHKRYFGSEYNQRRAVASYNRFDRLKPFRHGHGLCYWYDGATLERHGEYIVRDPYR